METPHTVVEFVLLRWLGKLILVAHLCSILVGAYLLLIDKISFSFEVT